MYVTSAKRGIYKWQFSAAITGVSSSFVAVGAGRDLRTSDEDLFLLSLRAATAPCDLDAFNDVKLDTRDAGIDSTLRAAAGACALDFCDVTAFVVFLGVSLSIMVATPAADLRLLRLPAMDAVLTKEKGKQSLK